MGANRERVGAAAARLQADLAEARQLADLSEFSPHAMVVHSDGVIRWANRETARLAGLGAPADLVGRSLLDFVDPRSRDQTARRIGRVLTEGGVLESAEAFLRSVDGRTLVVETRAARTSWHGHPAVHVVLWDVTQRHRFHATLEWEASHDPLTGIWNRRAVLRHLDDLLTAEGAHRPGDLAVALVDLDGFKAVNDVLGHQTGDRVLVHVARRLRSISASSAVGRLGGDEFLVVVCPAGAAATRDLAARIDQELRIERFGEVRLPTPLTATVGVASALPGGGTVESLLRAADADLYTKRRAGRRRPPRGLT